MWLRIVLSSEYNSPSNIFLIMLSSKIYHQKCQAFLAATGMNGLIHVYRALLISIPQCRDTSGGGGGGGKEGGGG